LKCFWGTVDLIATLLLRAVVASSAAAESLTKRLVAFIVRASQKRWCKPKPTQV